MKLAIVVNYIFFPVISSVIKIHFQHEIGNLINYISK